MNTNFKTALLHAGLVIAAAAGTTSCTNETASNDPVDIAQEQNDAKFDNKKEEKDAEFLVKATENSLEEIRLGKLAQEKGSIAEVVALGKMMEEAHTKSLKEVTALAVKRQVSVPAELKGKADEAFADLNGKSGNDFDKAYCSKMVDGHKDAIARFEKAAEESRDGEIKNFSKTMLPELRKHLDQVFVCQKKCEGNKGGSKTGNEDSKPY